MKYLVALLIVILALMPALALADTGGGAGIKAKADVVLGDNGVEVEVTIIQGSSGGSYWSGGYKYVEPSQPTATTPISDNATASLPATPTTPTPVTTVPPSQTFPPIPPAVGVPMPTEQGGLGIGGILLIGLAIIGGGFVGWQFISKQMEKRKEKMGQNEITVR